jgi:hypothetical protein
MSIMFEKTTKMTAVTIIYNIKYNYCLIFISDMITIVVPGNITMKLTLKYTRHVKGCKVNSNL